MSLLFELHMYALLLVKVYSDGLDWITTSTEYECTYMYLNESCPTARGITGSPTRNALRNKGTTSGHPNE